MIKRILLSVTALYLLLVLLPLPSLLCRDKDQNGQNPSPSSGTEGSNALSGGTSGRKARLFFVFMTEKAPPFSRYLNAIF